MRNSPKLLSDVVGIQSNRWELSLGVTSARSLGVLRAAASTSQYLRMEYGRAAAHIPAADRPYLYIQKGVFFGGAGDWVVCR